ncbi:hypothetical protein MAP00_007291 [Monascus purpureus]|nr:hypothetical protein MAP00_007291 [Monascus purpureus]
MDRCKFPMVNRWTRRTTSSPNHGLQGLSGLAALLVVVSQIVQAWDYSLLSPADDEWSSSQLLQWPILRVPWQGRIGIAVFAFQTGYMCALKPIQLSRTDSPLAVFTSVAKAAFRRLPQIVLPATIVLVLSWVVAQFGAFTVASRSDSLWCRSTAPVVEDSLWAETVRLVQNFLSTWTTGVMEYDASQWVLLPLLKASILVYLLLCATVFVKLHWRALIYLLMFLYFHQDAYDYTETFPMQAVYGLFLADLSYEDSFEPSIERHPITRKIVAAILAFAGLFIASYPGEHPEWASWSNSMLSAAYYLFPADVDIPRRYTALGLDLVILAIYISPTTRKILSRGLFTWLGKQSFAVYLLHGTLLRTVLCWMLYGISGQPWHGEIVDGNGNPIYDEDGEPMHPHWIARRPSWVVAICVPVWIALVYLSAALWTAYMDPFCGMVVRKLETAMSERGASESESESEDMVPAIQLDTMPTSRHNP